jgi:hypothetical protein
VLTIRRLEVKPFTDKQIELVKTFAAQAVIAIENTRLFNELRESLQQQTATADVLNVISSSPGELPPVFSAILANATSICEAKFGVLYLHEGGAFRAAATTPNAPPEYVKARKPELLLNPPPDGPLRRVNAKLPRDELRFVSLAARDANSVRSGSPAPVVHQRIRSHEQHQEL